MSGPGSIPGPGTKMLQAAWRGKKKRAEHLSPFKFVLIFENINTLPSPRVLATERRKFL